MKALYLTGAIVMGMVILIFSFANIQASCNYLYFFFWEVSSSLAPTFTIFGACTLGFFLGVFGTLFLKETFSKNTTDEEDDDFQV